MPRLLPRTHRLRRIGIAAVAVLATAAAQAQSSSSSSGYSVLPWTQQGYVGLNIGKPDYNNSCGTGPTCDDPDAALHVYTGGMFNEWLGLEVGYLNMGRADRAGGRTRAHGINLSLVGRIPVGAVNLFAKGGATYGRTEVSADLLSGVSSGKGRGTGLSVGAGVGYDFGRNSSVVLEYGRHDFHFAGAGRKAVDLTSVGYMHRF
jgi:OmpA-OmpF porin, OOP family